MNLEEAIEYAQGALHPDWTLDLDIHAGKLSLELYDQDGDLRWASELRGPIPYEIIRACVISHDL